MSRIILASVFTALLAAASLHAAPEQAPPPREIHGDGQRDPAPTPQQGPREDPLETVERIIKNSRDVSDKLARMDTSASTRETQERILRDIRSLLQQDDNPPPPKPDQSPDKKKDDKDPKDPENKQDQKQDQKQDMMPMSGMNEPMPSKKDMQPNAGNQQPSEQPAETDEQPRERRPRQQHKDQGRDGGTKQEKNQPSGPRPPEPKPGGKVEKNSSGSNDPLDKGKPRPSMPMLPHEDEMSDEVWGHLRSRLRREVMQFSKQEYIPRYSKLMEYYYSSPTDRSMKK
jgi:hypothetical protein